MRNTFLIIFLGALISCMAKDAQSFRVVNATELKTMEVERKDLVFLDVRTPGEIANGYIQDALLIDFRSPSFAQEIKKLDHAVPYLVYCASGIRSNKAMQMMKDWGFEEVYDLEGGYKSYQPNNE